MARRLPILAAIAEGSALAMEATRAALEEYEDLVVEEARQLAPVRQAFKNPKGQRKRSRSLVGTDLDSGMSAPLPGEKITKALIGTGRGRGARMLIQRHGYTSSGRQGKGLLNRRGGGRDFIIGKMTHTKRVTGDEVTNFKGRAGATAHQTEIGRAAARSGHGSRPKYGTGYALGSRYQSQLTPRARSNLGRGIGVNKVGGRSFSLASGGSLILGGALRDSIHGMGVEETNNGLEVRITASVRYAPYVEYGTYKDYAQPFLRPAIKNSKQNLGPILKKHLRAAGFVAKG